MNDLWTSNVDPVPCVIGEVDVDCLQVALERGNTAHDPGTEVDSALVKAYGHDSEAARGKQIKASTGGFELIHKVSIALEELENRHPLWNGESSKQRGHRKQKRLTPLSLEYISSLQKVSQYPSFEHYF